MLTLVPWWQCVCFIACVRAWRSSCPDVHNRAMRYGTGTVSAVLHCYLACVDDFVNHGRGRCHDLPGCLPFCAVLIRSPEPSSVA